MNSKMTPITEIKRKKYNEKSREGIKDEGKGNHPTDISAHHIPIRRCNQADFLLLLLRKRFVLTHAFVLLLPLFSSVIIPRSFGILQVLFVAISNHEMVSNEGVARKGESGRGEVIRIRSSAPARTLKFQVCASPVTVMSVAQSLQESKVDKYLNNDMASEAINAHIWAPQVDT